MFLEVPIQQESLSKYRRLAPIHVADSLAYHSDQVRYASEILSMLSVLARL